MDSKISILQWNCQGLHAKFESLKVLINEHSPACISLQETMLGLKSFYPRDYILYHRLMEKMVNVRLIGYLEQKRIITPAQCGFRRLHSCTDILVRLESSICEAFVTKKTIIYQFSSIWRKHMAQHGGLGF